jgi:hypothetical protein
MNTGSKLSGNTVSSSTGGGVYVNGGTFTMSGGEISGNTASSSSGGGVYVASGGTFTMSGGEISGNTASPSSSSSYPGGGVYVASGGTFTMSGGEISGNTASSRGGGVFVYSSGTFTMEGGAISGNTASSSSYGGGGVFVSGGTFTMSGGEISGNTASFNGGGVYVYSSGTFAMSGGKISGNTTSYEGGGVYVVNDGTFTKQTGAVIYGSDAEDGLKNTATNDSSYGHAVYVASSPAKIRSTTADSSLALNSGVKGAAGGWEEALGTIKITLQPVPVDPPLSNTLLFVHDRPSFSAGDEYTSYAWYWDGVQISGATSSTYTWEPYSKEPGIYELAVVVTTSTGERRSARCRVTFKAYSGISNISYDDTWTLQEDGSRQSPELSDNDVTKARISFISGSSNTSITIQLKVSSEEGNDLAFISGLDNPSATYSSGFYSGSRISGENTVTITIPVSTSGSHFVDIGYRKDNSASLGSDCAWFTVMQ